MARLILLLLLVTAGALVVAILFDRRGRREAAIDGLRWAFVHGTPPARYSRPATLADFEHPGGVRFRAPAGWEVQMASGDREVRAAAAGAGRRVVVAVTRLEPAGAAAGRPAVDALEGLAGTSERSLEVLPNGNALMKTLEVVRAERSASASYAWRLARTASSRGVQLAVFRIDLPLDAATDVIA